MLCFTTNTEQWGHKQTKMDERLKKQARYNAQTKLNLNAFQQRGEQKQVNGVDINELYHEVRPGTLYCPVTDQREEQGRHTDNERKTQQRWLLLCHKAVNNVLGLIGVLVDLQRETTSQLKRDNLKMTQREVALEIVSHQFHFKGKQHMLQIRRHLVLGSSGSVLDGIKNKLAVVTHPVQQQWRVYLLLLKY